MTFLKSLSESRMYQRLGSLQGTSVTELAIKLFEHLLALQILAIKRPSRAARYADSVMSQQQFDAFRTSQPDLYNLIALILNQEKYSDRILKNNSISVPEMRLKRCLRDVASGRIDNDDFSQLMLMLQRTIPQLPSQVVNLRREISDWQDLRPSQRRDVSVRLLQQMQQYSFNSDLYHLLRDET